MGHINQNHFFNCLYAQKVIECHIIYNKLLVGLIKHTNQEPNFWKLSRTSGLSKNPGLNLASLRRKLVNHLVDLNFNNSHQELTSAMIVTKLLLYPFNVSVSII